MAFEKSPALTPLLHTPALSAKILYIGENPPSASDTPSAHSLVGPPVNVPVDSLAAESFMPWETVTIASENCLGLTPLLKKAGPALSNSILYT